MSNKTDMSDIVLYEYIYDKRWIKKYSWQQISDSLQLGLSRGSMQKKYKRLCDKVKQEYKPEEPDEQEDTQEEIPLELTLELNGIYNEGDPIPVTATLTNIGDETLIVSEMNIKTGTLDFYIDTPNGDTIHFIGPVDDSGMRLWKLEPQESEFHPDMDITCGYFGIDPPWATDLPYEFVEGEYTITGAYRSFATQEYTSSAFWEGELDSRTYEFTIIPK